MHEVEDLAAERVLHRPGIKDAVERAQPIFHRRIVRAADACRAQMNQPVATIAIVTTGARASAHAAT